MNLLRQLILAALLLSAFCASAQTTIRVGPTATGNGSGSDWNNLAQWSSVTLTRGNTYVFRGSETQYGGRTLNTANSGTTRITLKYAWPDEYGSETGWSNTFTNNFARFSGTLDFKTDYWTVTGVRRDSVNWTNGFGFWLAQGQSFTDGGPAGDHLEFIYLKFGASLDDGIANYNTNRVKTPIYFRGSTYKTNLLVFGCFAHLDSFAQNAGVDTVSYVSNVFYVGYAKEAIRGQYGARNGQILYNRFFMASMPDDFDESATSSTAVIGIWDESVEGSFDNWTVIGNNIWFPTPVNTSDGAISIGGNYGTNGTVGLAGVPAHNVTIRSNTIVGYNNGKARILINGGYNAGDNRVIRDNRFYDAPNWSVSTSGVDHGNNEALGAAPWSTWNEFIAYGLSEGGEPEPPSGPTATVGTLIITGP